MPDPPAENTPLTDVYVCGVMEPEDPAAPPPKLRWSLFASQSPAAVVGMPAMRGAGDYHTICGPVLARTTRGTLLMFAVGRRDARDDVGDIDVILRRSTDWGATWSGRRNISAMARRDGWYWYAEPSYAGYSTLIEIDGDRVGIAYDRHPRLSYRTFYLEDCT